MSDSIDNSRQLAKPEGENQPPEADPVQEATQNVDIAEDHTTHDKADQNEQAESHGVKPASPVNGYDDKKAAEMKGEELVQVINDENGTTELEPQGITETANSQTESDNEKSKRSDTDETTNKAVGTVTKLPLSEAQEVSSTISGKNQQRSMRSSRRTSYSLGRPYSGSFQNYGLTYLPYKSNFEPSEDARRKADEFFKTLNL